MTSGNVVDLIDPVDTLEYIQRKHGCHFDELESFSMIAHDNIVPLVLKSTFSSRSRIIMKTSSYKIPYMIHSGWDYNENAERSYDRKVSIIAVRFPDFILSTNVLIMNMNNFVDSSFNLFAITKIK